MKKQLILAVDQGGHASRALVFDGKGRLLGGATETVLERRWRDRVELEAVELLASVQRAIEQALEPFGGKGMELAAGIATQRSSLVCWDRETGAALSPVLSWQDRRAQVLIRQLAPFAEQVHQATGLYLSPHYGASKMQWCLTKLPEVREALEGGRLCIGPLASFLTFHLIQGRPLVIDPANASRTLLWNLRSRDWDPALLSLFRIPGAVLPRCVMTRSQYGLLDLKGQRIPVRVLTGDQSAALYSLGRPRPDALYVNLGTGAFIQKPIQGAPPADLLGLLASPVYQDSEGITYVLEGTVNGAGSALRQAARQLELPDLEEALPEWLEREGRPPLFLNGVSGLGSPFWAPHFRSRFIGRGAGWEKAVAVAESIVFLLKVNIEAFAQLAPPCAEIQVSGGLARLDGLCQRLADVTAMRVYRPVEAEATARGLAFLVADMPHDWPEPGPGIWFTPAENTPLQQRYARWRRELERSL